jgi:hypothetical protein
MSSLSNDFNELVMKVKQGREFTHASFEPIYYLVFHPQQILEVKQRTPAWTAKLKNDGWEVTNFSIAENIVNTFSNAPTRKIWLQADRANPTDWSKTNQALANELNREARLQKLLENAIADVEGRQNALVLVTDLEALHPYLRIGAIEAQLQGKFHVPTVFLYPGVRTGKTRLKFLGFYPEDGNYRSVHVGG